MFEDVFLCFHLLLHHLHPATASSNSAIQQLHPEAFTHITARLWISNLPLSQEMTHRLPPGLGVTRKPQRHGVTATRFSLLRSRRGGPPARAKQSGDRKYRNTSDRFGSVWKGSVWRLKISKTDGFSHSPFSTRICSSPVDTQFLWRTARSQKSGNPEKKKRL